MRDTRAIFASLLAIALLASGNAGLRALHLSVAEFDASQPEHACGHAHAHAGHGGDHDHVDGHGAPAAPAHDEQDCATCELLLTLASHAGPAPAVPTFLACVVAADAAPPACRPAPTPLRALSPRPPPAA